MSNADAERLRLVRALFPELAARVDTAYLSFADHSIAGENRRAGFDAWLDNQVSSVLPGAASLTIDDGALAARFDRAFVAARTAAKLLSIEVPEVEAFVEAGVDLSRLAEALKADPSLVPVPAPYDLGAHRWIEAFAAPMMPRLLIAEDAAREFQSLDVAPDPASPTVQVRAGRGNTGGSDTGGGNTRGNNTGSGNTGAGNTGASNTGASNTGASNTGAGNSGDRKAVRWTLRLIPAGTAPALMGLSFAHGPHVSLPEILMLQLMRASAGETPLDATSFTWLAGSLAQGKLAARHVYDATEDAIRITCREVVSQGPHLGARPPIG